MTRRESDIETVGGATEQYSTEEQLTGDIWLDGKPIYQRIFVGEITFNAQSESHELLGGAASAFQMSFETIIEAYGRWDRGDGQFYLYPGYRPLIHASILQGIFITSSDRARTRAPYVLTVRYTKK